MSGLSVFNKNMDDIKQRLLKIQASIRQAEVVFYRQKGSVQLLAVSKTKPARDITIAYQQGQRHFGESYVQEAIKKQQELAAFDITWHFIGPIQSNKTKAIAQHFSWVHSVDRLKIAKRLSEQRPNYLPKLNICLQINIDQETTKSGFLLEALPQMMDEINQLPNLQLRGVMAIPKPCIDIDAQREPYRQIHQMLNNLNHAELDTLSFGMSGDLEAAIAEGSTIVRIGSALFGQRSYPQKTSQRLALRSA